MDINDRAISHLVQGNNMAASGASEATSNESLSSLLQMAQLRAQLDVANWDDWTVGPDGTEREDLAPALSLLAGTQARLEAALDDLADTQSRLQHLFVGLENLADHTLSCGFDEQHLLAAREKWCRAADSKGLCAICMGEIQLVETVFVLPCHAEHCFHSACIEPWFVQSASCPTCRADCHAALAACEEHGVELDSEPDEACGDGDRTFRGAADPRVYQAVARTPRSALATELQPRATPRRHHMPTPSCASPGQGGLAHRLLAVAPRQPTPTVQPGRFGPAMLGPEGRRRAIRASASANTATAAANAVLQPRGRMPVTTQRQRR